MRDADVLLFDAACDLLLAARSLRATAGTAGSEAAAAPVLACLGETLQQLELTMATLGAQRAHRRGEHRVRAALDDVEATLRLAGRAVESARAATADAAQARGGAAPRAGDRRRARATVAHRRRDDGGGRRGRR